MKNRLYILTVLLGSVQTHAQTFNSYEHIDINNFNQRIMVHGDLWWDITSSKPAAEFPKGSGKHALFAGAIWMAAHDDQGQLKVAAQTYRQNGNDYWPGPLDQNGMLSMATSTNWARIWKVNKTTIDSFKAIGIHTIANTHPSILEWPAIQNPYAKGANGSSLTITMPMAPFIDKNGDGKYDPTKGDYPDIKGDQMLWWVFSDNGPTHDLSKTEALKVEIHAAAYAYKRNTLIDNVVYYEYSVKNKSVFDYQDFRVGIWTDADLGYHADDYMGCDSARRLGYIYNGKSEDGTGSPEHYGSQIPTSGIVVIRSPNDNAGYRAPLGSFIFAPSSTSPSIPLNAGDYDKSLRSTYQDGTHITYGGTGKGGSVNSNYLFTGDPGKFMEWSECSINNAPGDRRFVIASNDYEFKKGSTVTYVFATVATPATNQGCPNFANTTIKEVADTAINQFGDPLSVPSIATKASSLKIYPNPASDNLIMEAGNMENATVTVYGLIGNKVLSASSKGNKLELDISHLPAGVYHVICRHGGETSHGKFLKQ